MSRVGRKPVIVPPGVSVVRSGDALEVEGPGGKLSVPLHAGVDAAVEDGRIQFRTPGDSAGAGAWQGLARALARNAVEGVSRGHSRELEVHGVGYRVAMQGEVLVLALGYSHEVRYSPPAGIRITCPKPNAIVVGGCDRQQVGQVAAEIRGLRPPEPYKGKGIRYRDEELVRKEGKKK